MVAALQRSFERQGAVDIFGDDRGKALQLGELQRGELALARFRVTHGLRNRLVRVAERHALAHQVVGEVGGRGVPLARSGGHRLALDLDAAEHLGEHGEARGQGVHHVEQRFLVLLVIAVVRERLRFHEGQQRHQVTVDASGLAANQLGDIRVLLLRHDRGAGGERIRDRDKAEARVGPEDELFAEPRQVRHRERRAGAEFDREVAVGHRVDRVLAHLLEAELLRDPLAVDGE